MNSPLRHPLRAAADASNTPRVVYVVDADDRFRADLATHFAAKGIPTEGFRDAAAFFKRLRQLRPGCVIADMGLPDMRGLELQRALAGHFSCLPLVFVATDAPVPTVAEAIRLGACDFILKPLDLNALADKTLDLLENVRRRAPRELRRESVRRRLATLTGREYDILMLALTGKSNKEVSQVLDISHRTVETHRTHILQKIGVANLLELAHIFSDLPPLSGIARAPGEATQAHAPKGARAPRGGRRVRAQPGAAGTGTSQQEQG